MQSTVLVSSFAEIAREKDIDRDTLQVIIEDVFRAMIKKRYGADDPEAFQIIFNPDNGDYQILHVREVVEDYDLEDPVTQIEWADAVAIDEEYDIEDEVAVQIQIEDFGRRAVQAALQTFRQRIRDIEKENIYREYSELIDEIVVGEIYQTRRREVLVLHNKTELVLPRPEQIQKDRYRKGDMLRAVVLDVDRDAGSSPQVIISRVAPVFIERLFELEVPEIYDGIIEIKKIVRLPGERAKMAVISHDDRVDPVGACVGVKGSRIHAVVRELGGENIDVVPWTNDTIEFIKRSLAPAKPIAVELNDDLDPPRARVTVPADEVSMAIGRGGQNIRLASMLTGYELDVYRDIKSDEEDVDIDEFSDAIPPEIIQRLKDIGCDTAKAVLELQPSELARRTELTEEQAQKITWLMEAEFERDPEAEVDAAGARAETLADLATDDATVDADLEATSDDLGADADEVTDDEIVAEGDASSSAADPDDAADDAETFTEADGQEDEPSEAEASEDADEPVTDPPSA
ncbi:transcription termination factor NusA [Rubrivirga marina]|uniref:Transcription termination/antitermination protein NusA n=1 Tax=Rubrivirga marina TaxID=1196024 RepID=A0A271J4S6_9BACT|nr:transcription termination factor NusA [Rubrivirga marina]PAP77679.1 transcription termination/antitermination protein NusA [Rubrivirga marina]